MIRIGVDIGRSLVKIARPDPATGTPRTDGFPPAMVDGWQETIAPLGGLADRDAPVMGRIGSWRFTVSPYGEMVRTDVSPRKVGRRTGALLLAAAARVLAETDGNGPVRIVTGLPVRYASVDAQALIETVGELLREGVEFRVGGKTVRLGTVDIAVIAEGDGLLVEYARLSGPPALAAVVDIGYVTTNVVTYTGYTRSGFRTIPLGGYHVFERYVREFLEPRWGPFPLETPHLVAEQWAASGRAAVWSPARGGPSEEEARAALAEAVDAVRSALLDEVLVALPIGAGQTVPLILGGGGVDLFRIAGDFPTAWVPPAPRFAQARGYLRVAEELEP